MKPNILCALLLHHSGVVGALLDSSVAAGQEEFEGAETYAKWRFIASAGSLIGKSSPLPDKANGG